jgi:hypothetical protein
MDFVAASAAIDCAIEVLDLHGRVAAAEHLRVHGPELLRLARLGQTAHDLRGRDCRECEHHPTDSPAPERGNGG